MVKPGEVTRSGRGLGPTGYSFLLSESNQESFPGLNVSRMWIPQHWTLKTELDKALGRLV